LKFRWGENLPGSALAELSEFKAKRPESEIKKEILKYLNAQYCTFAFSVPTTGIPDGKGGFRKNQNRGCSDIIGCKHGKFFALEVKRPGGIATELQRSFLARVDMQGAGYAAIVYSLDDAREAWEEI